MEMTIQDLATTIRDLAATIDDLARMMMRQFDRIDERFDRLEKRVMHVEEIVEEHSGKFISIEDQLSRITYILEDSDPRPLKKRVEKLEQHTFGSIQAA